MNESDSNAWTPEYTGGRCLCDDCCRQCPERLIEREEMRKRVFHAWTPEQNAQRRARRARDDK